MQLRGDRDRALDVPERGEPRERDGLPVASTNLVFEIGIVLWVFIGWRFVLAEFVGGLFLIALMWLGIRLLVARRVEAEARAHAQAAAAGHQHTAAVSAGLSWRERLTSSGAWSDVAYNFRGDWEMLWKEIGAGFVIAGFIALLPLSFFNDLFVTDSSSGPRLLENVVVGPLVAVASFVCSVGNVPLAAVLWAGGISFSGVIAFIYADLIIIPIVIAYRRFYGWRLTWKLVLIMFATMVAAALAVDGIFSAAGLIPVKRPSIQSISSRGIHWNYTTALDIVFAFVAAWLFWLTVRRGARDPVCGMAVDRLKTPYRSGGQFFCSARCLADFEASALAHEDGLDGPRAAESDRAGRPAAAGSPPAREE